MHTNLAMLEITLGAQGLPCLLNPMQGELLLALPIPSPRITLSALW